MIPREELDRLVAGAPVGFAITDAEGTVLWTNPRLAELVGPGRAEPGRRLAELPGVPAAELAALWDGPGEGGLRRRAPVPGPSGTPRREVEVELRPLDAAPPRRWLVIAQEPLRTEDDARAAIFYQSFLTSTNAIEITDARGVLLDVNPAFERIYGYRREECIGRRPNLVRSRHTRPEVYERMWADLLDPAKGHWSGEILNRDRHGRERPVLLTVTAVKDPAGRTTHYVGVAVDLSERRQWEASLAHPDRLASIGQLAAGVAHEINTPLANVMLVAESLRRRTTDPWAQARIDTIVAQVDHAARIVRGLLDFARRSEPRFGPVDLREVVRTAIDFVEGKRAGEADLGVRLGGVPLVLSGDRGQLVQVLTNLLTNAYDAIAERTDGGPRRIVVEARADGPDAVVTVADTGPGIPERVLAHLFEPFVTTKPEGRGTGLGLAICHGIVQSHHGTIRALRNPDGPGTAFEIRLPLSPEPPRGPPAGGTGNG
ncbi:MAG: PAS domain S-box protein [Thermoplasmata archaeon]